MAPSKLVKYQSKRNFDLTQEPRGEVELPPSHRLRFVVQRHAARRLHYDLRLEVNGVFKSWAVTRGPSLDPHDKRLAVEVEDHPLEYGDFEGTIPKTEYGGGTIQLWDRGYWTPEHMTSEEGLAGGDLKFTLEGTRLKGSWVLVRIKDRHGGKRTNWLLIKHRDAEAVEGDSDALLVDSSVASGRTMAEIATGVGPTPKPFMSVEPAAAEKSATPRKRRAKQAATMPPAQGAVRGAIPNVQKPQLASVAEVPPSDDGWVSEIKFDGYRLIAALHAGKVRLLTRGGLDWADRMPAVAKAIARMGVSSVMLDGELVLLHSDGVSSFPGLQAALKAGRDNMLTFYAFDLLHLNGWDLRACTLLERKRVLADLTDWKGMLRYSEHHAGDTAAMRRSACHMHLEGIICKQAAAPYRAGRGTAWLKLKCGGREEFILLGYTPPAKSRVGFGSLHVGYHDPDGRLHYAGGIGTGFDDAELTAIRARLETMAAPPPTGLLLSGDPIDHAVVWVRPEMIIECQFTGWSGAGRVRHAVYLGIREDKSANEVVRDVADADAVREVFKPTNSTTRIVGRKRGHVAVPPLPQATAASAQAPAQHKAASARVVVTRASKRGAETVAGVEITHASRALWPGISKRDLAEYWKAVAKIALPGIAHRPLSILRCPEGIEGREHFFQKNGHGIMPPAIREGLALKQPYLALDDLEGLVAMAQMSAIELHSWGAAEQDPTRPDRLVFDLDPGEGVEWPDVIRAAHDIREKLSRLGLDSWCRTTGGKGFHVVVPLKPEADWSAVKLFCHALAETMASEEPARFVAHLKIVDRAGRILIDWLRNDLGATAIASFSPRARPGATVATPVSWAEVTPRLNPKDFSIQTIPSRLAKLKHDPWEGFAKARQLLPKLSTTDTVADTSPAKATPPRSRIVKASRPKRRT